MKKNLFLTCIYAALALSTSAQFSKGTIFVGPSLGTNSYQSSSDGLDYTAGNNLNKTSTSKSNTISVGPQLGVFLTDHLVLGGSMSYSHSASNTNSTTALTNGNLLQANSNSATTTFNAGPFLRYYYYTSLSRNVFYGQLNGTLGSGSGTSSGNGNSNMTSTYQSNGSKSGLASWNAGGSIGVTHFFNESIGMDIAVGYAFNSTRSNSQNSTNTTSDRTEIVTSTVNNYKETLQTHGITLGLGFHWFFRKVQ